MSELLQIQPAPAGPVAISKSIVKAMGCETYYAGHYLSRAASILRLVESPWSKTGTDFHLYRAEYVSHLVAEGRGRDEEWGRDWLASNPVTADARNIILDDLRVFSVDPELVFGTELFLSIDRNFRPLELRYGQTPGVVSSAENALVSGSIDRLDIDGRRARVIDCKSGWSTATVADYEPPNYAALVMAHFPAVDHVAFEWEFVRVHASKGAEYSRADLSWIHPLILSEWERKEDIARRYYAGEELSVSPWAGNCPFCALRCPLRALVEGGALTIPPVQTEADARSAAAVMYQSEMLGARAREALKPFLDEHGGALELGNDFVLESLLGVTEKYGLLDTLSVLGAVPRDDYGQPIKISPRYAVPLSGLFVSSTALKGYAERQKRAGCMDELHQIARAAPRGGIRIRRRSEGVPGAGEDEAA